MNALGITEEAQQGFVLFRTNLLFTESLVQHFFDRLLRALESWNGLKRRAGGCVLCSRENRALNLIVADIERRRKTHGFLTSAELKSCFPTKRCKLCLALIIQNATPQDVLDLRQTGCPFFEPNTNPCRRP